MRDVTVAILAGGAGSRLGGRDKGLVELAGKPLVAHLRAALPLEANVLIVANRHHADYARFGRVVPDLDSGTRGPLAGIATALAEATTDFIATLPVDCPQPPRNLVERLTATLNAANASAPSSRRTPGSSVYLKELDSGFRRNDEIRIAVAYDGTRRQPLFALYHRSLADSARAALERDAPVWRWQGESGAVDVDFSDVAANFDNLNTEQDFAAWTERLRTAAVRSP